LKLSDSNTTSSTKSAEATFRAAFDRLKRGVPEVLQKGSRISQNNVAKEAGCDPSALRKSRFPSLVLEIQQWVSEHASETSLSKRQEMLGHRRRNRSLREQLAEFKIERDHALSLLVQADAKIVELTQDLAEKVAKLERLSPTAIHFTFPATSPTKDID